MLIYWDENGIVLSIENALSIKHNLGTEETALSIVNNTINPQNLKWTTLNKEANS